MVIIKSAVKANGKVKEAKELINYTAVETPVAGEEEAVVSSEN